MIQLPAAILDFLSTLTVSQGRHVGQPFNVLPWQRRFIRGAFSVPGDALLSLARGGGKTTFTAALGTAALDGPLVEPNAETLLVASSFEQGLVAWRHVLAFLRPAIEANPKRWRIQDSSNRASVTDRATGASLRVLGSDPRRLHGAAPKLILADEVAQWPSASGQIDEMLAALSTSRGKIPGSKMLWLGTRPASPDHPFERARKTVSYAQVHAADPEAPPFRKSTWTKACPSLPYMPDLLAQYRLEAAAAKIDPSALASFKALRLNAGTADTVEAVLVEAALWRALEIDGDVGPGRLYVLGLDLGQNSALSAAVAYWPGDGFLDSFAVCPETPSLEDKGRADAVGRLYLDMARRGELIQAGARVADIDYLLRETLDRWGRPSAIVCDAWREAELRQILERIGFPMAALVVRRMGWKDGGEDVRRFRAACVDRRVRPKRSLLMRSCLSEARTVSDPAGNAKLAKSQFNKRDDAAAAAILAVAEGERRRDVLSESEELQYALAG